MPVFLLEMDKIMEIAGKDHLRVIEDAVQGMMSSYHGKALGTLGDFGCYSFYMRPRIALGVKGWRTAFTHLSFIEMR